MTDTARVALTDPTGARVALTDPTGVCESGVCVLNRPFATPFPANVSVVVAHYGHRQFCAVAVPHLPGVADIRLAGELDCASAPILRTAVESLLAAGARNITVNISALQFLDAAGIGALIHARNSLIQLAGHLVIEGLQGPPLRVVALCGLTGLLTDNTDRATRSNTTQPVAGHHRADPAAPDPQRPTQPPSLAYSSPGKEPIPLTATKSRTP